VQPLERGGGFGPALGVSAAYLSLDGIEARTGNTAQADRVFGASDFSAGFSYAHPLSRRPGTVSSLGVTAKFIQQKIDDRQANAYAADVGFFQRFRRFQAGMVVTNMGSPVQFLEESYPLPRTFRLSLSYLPRTIPLLGSAGVESVRGDSALAYRFGTEYRFGEMLAFRLGYAARSGSTQRALRGAGLGTVSDSEFARFTGLVGGMGFRFFGYGLDYAFVPYGELGNSHKVTLSARF